MENRMKEKLTLKRKLKEAFRDRRNALGFTQQEVADMLGIEIKTYQKWEGDGTGLSDISNVLKAFRVLRFPTSETIQLLGFPPLSPSEAKDIFPDGATLKAIEEAGLCSYIGRQCAGMADDTIAVLLDTLSAENLRRHK